MITSWSGVWQSISMTPKEKLSVRTADPPWARVLAQLGNRQHDASAALTRAGAATVAGRLGGAPLR
jgi:hypothetical protein